jgi:hypothetical protein
LFTPRVLRISSPSPLSRHLLARSSCSLASALLRRLPAPEVRSWSNIRICFCGVIRNEVELFGFSWEKFEGHGAGGAAGGCEDLF